MGRTEAGWTTVRELSVRQGKIALLGLVVVLVPIVVVVTSIQHAHKLVDHAVGKVLPGVQAVGGVGIATVTLLAIFVACWFVGWLVSRTERGKRFMGWEKSELLGRSPLQVRKEVAKVRDMQEGTEAPAPTKEVQPVLAHVAGGWQPGVIVEEVPTGWATVFLPDIPSVDKGRLHLVEGDKLVRLDVPLDEYRKKLTTSGHDSVDWLEALARHERTST